MSQSVKVTRWGAPVHNQDESSYNIFKKYVGDQGQNHFQYSKKQSRKLLQKQSRIDQEGRSQMIRLESGFQKFKNNQTLALKELKQQYQILKNLPIEDRVSLTPKDPQSVNSSIRDYNSIPSSKNSKNQKKITYIKIGPIISSLKKQLEIVIGNNMKKVQELLHNEMEYKKQIHQLKLQLDGKGKMKNIKILQELQKKIKHNHMIQLTHLKEKQTDQKILINNNFKILIVQKLNSLLKISSQENHWMKEGNLMILFDFRRISIQIQKLK